MRTGILLGYTEKGEAQVIEVGSPGKLITKAKALVSDKESDFEAFEIYDKPAKRYKKPRRIAAAPEAVQEAPEEEKTPEPAKETSEKKEPKKGRGRPKKS